MVAKDGVVVSIEPLMDSAGVYEPKKNQIRLDPGFSTAPGTITHEFVHHLKTKENRRGPVTSSQIRNGMNIESLNLEEASTTAETITRLSPYHRPKNPSYYRRVPGVKTDAEAYRRMDKDRLLFVGNATHGKQGLKGKKAIRSVERGFQESEIGELRHRSPRSAKDSVKLLQKSK